MPKSIFTDEEFEAAVNRVYGRKLTKSVKKASHQAPRALDCFHESNMYWSDESTSNFLQGSDIAETYRAMKDQGNL